jgi:hypothetical protein
MTFLKLLVTLGNAERSSARDGNFVCLCMALDKALEPGSGVFEGFFESAVLILLRTCRVNSFLATVL